MLVSFGVDYDVDDVYDVDVVVVCDDVDNVDVMCGCDG